MSLSNSRIARAVAMVSAAMVAVTVLEVSGFHLLAATQNDKPAAKEEPPAEGVPEKTAPEKRRQSRAGPGRGRLSNAEPSSRSGVSRSS